MKLYKSYLAMAFVPLMLAIMLILTMYVIAGKHDLREMTGNEKNESFEQALVYGELNYILQYDTAKLDDVAYIQSLDDRLDDAWAGLVIAQNNKVEHISPFLQRLFEGENWNKYLYDVPTELTLDLYRFATKAETFTYPDGSLGQLILFYRLDPIPMFWHPVVMMVFLGFIALTSFLLTYIVSRSIIKPIQSLRSAALRIKEGDLSFPVLPQNSNLGQPIAISGIKEINQLSVAFEEMRVRLKSSIDQSLQYEENRKQLLSHISHDLKTPISAIKGYIEGIIDGIASTDEMRMRYLKTIYNKAEHMDELIEELFLYSKLDLQTVAYDFKRIELSAYVEHFMEEQHFELEKSNIALRFIDTTDGSISISADPEKLNRVLLNILNNCVKYLERDEALPHRVEVRLKEDERFAIIEIEDNGPGIDEVDLPFIFERFYRAEKSRNSETGGSGLGLAIVKQIIEGHHGYVYADNGLLGALFIIRLPKQTTRVVKDYAANTYH
ncbi:sensor histidine kinase [Paenibacillus yanchengensis]